MIENTRYRVGWLGKIILQIENEDGTWVDAAVGDLQNIVIKTPPRLPNPSETSQTTLVHWPDGQIPMRWF